MIAFQLLRLRLSAGWVLCMVALALCHACVPCRMALGQDLSWVNSALERSKSTQRENLPAWQFDPRVAASNADAALNGLSVVNPDRLFAVGDRGLILSSIDGGRSWQSQASFTSHNLYSVAFFDEMRGIAVGGTIQPLSQSSLGIVLVTSDGGKSWQAVASSDKAALPRLTGVSIDHQTLRAWGDYSSAHGCAVFESSDQGRTWQPIAAPLGHVQAVARERHGLILGLDHAGRLAQIPHNLNRNFVQLASPTMPIHALIHTGSQWLAVGDNATVTTSRDGVNWVDHSLPLSEPARNVCSLRCATAIEQSIWIAGTPGSILLHSPDGGQTWRVVPIDQAWSVSAIQFIDRHRGWLVTTAGSVWATRDGGASWFAQRVPVKRLGLQAIAASASDISWPALANATWQARQATELIAVFRENMEDTVDVAPDAPSTLRTLGGQLGLTGAWHSSRWPRTSSTLAGSRAPGSLGVTQPTTDPLASQLAQSLAMHLRAGRPSVVLIDDLSGAARGDESLAEVVTQAVWLAESDQPGLDWLKRELHLAPWKSTKLLSVSAAERADFTISAEELLRDSGLAMQDVLAPVFGKQSLGFSNTSLRCLQLSTGNSASRQNMFSNQDRLPETTRDVDLTKIGNLQLVMGRSHREKAWQALGPTPLNADEDLNVWIKKLDTVLQQTPKHECGAALLQLSQRCLAAQQWQRWSILMERVSQQSPWSDSARYGSLQIMRVMASEEFLAWQATSPTGRLESDGTAGPLALASSPRAARLGNPQDSDPFESPASNDKAGIADGMVATAGATSKKIAQSAMQPSAQSPMQAPTQSATQSATQSPLQSSVQPAAVRTVSAQRPVSPAEMARALALRQAVSEFNRLSELDRGLVLRPDIQLAHFARRRALTELAGDPAPDTGSLQALTTKLWLAGWPQVAAQEFIMAGGRADRPAWSARAVRTAEPPLLNGSADDACWQVATAIELVNPFLPPSQSIPSNATATRAMFAYDDEFLYGYVVCPQLGTPSERDATGKPRSPRRYDMQLDGTDHFVVQLDTDRDYASANELAINRAGHTYDRCCGHSQWNPRWHVDVQSTDNAWSAEFAIRLSDLTTRSPTAGTAWAISAFRYVPNWGLQSWSQLRSSVPRPQGNGLLVFE